MKVMNKLRPIITSHVICVVIAFFFFANCHAEQDGKIEAIIYTICQRTLCLETEVDANRLSKSMAHKVDEFINVSTNELFVAYDSLMKYLVDDLDLSQCKVDGYDYDHVVFSFYEYYLQIIPFVENDKEYLYINAYRRGWDKHDHSDESPSKRFVAVFGGGSNFWRVVYDIEKGTFIKFKINGVS